MSRKRNKYDMHESTVLPHLSFAFRETANATFPRWGKEGCISTLTALFFRTLSF